MIESRPELSKLSDYVPGKSIEEIRERFGLAKIVKLASNENPMGASPKAVEAIHGIADSLHLYPRGDAPNLIGALSNFYSVKKSQIVVGNGSDEIIDMVGKAFIRSGDNCVAITPTFSVYKFTTLSNGADFIGVGEGDGKTSLDDLLAKVNSKTRVVFICSPNNPTGVYYTAAELENFLSKVSSSTLVFLDQAYAEFATAEDYPQMFNFLEKYPNLLINRTFSKIYGLAGIRVGYAIAGEEVIKALWKIKPPFDINQAAQVAAIAALGDREHVERTLKMNREGLEYLKNEISAMGFKVLETQGNFICVHIGEKAKDMVAFLEQRGMIIRGLSSFGLPEHVRITMGRPEENQFLVKLMKEWVG
ncbi:MAG: histidinol-phosphate transaminase [Fibrobacteraceae bacterium]|nr:histidinol-phosphate transaminase [Fibrobacteraceae bacterium]